MFRELLRESGYPLDPLVEGVRQEDLASLERTLLALATLYSQQPGARREIRKLVITAKDHARLAARNPELALSKQEMVLWMITWLENPEVFEAWVPLRRAHLGKSPG